MMTLRTKEIILVPNPPSTGNTELDAYLQSVRDAINTAAKPVAGWKLSDFHASVSEVISEERDLIDIVTAWDDLINIRNDFRVEVERYEALYSDSKVLGEQYEDYADTFSQIMEWWDQNALLLEGVESFVEQVTLSESSAFTDSENAKQWALEAQEAKSQTQSAITNSTQIVRGEFTDLTTRAESARDAAVSAKEAAEAAAQTAGDGVEGIATAAAKLEVDKLKAGAPEAFDTLAEIAAELEANETDRASLANAIGLKADKTYVDTEVAKKAEVSHQHPVTDITATGTRSATTYLRGDGSWTTPTNTTYSVPTQAEAEAGTATTGRAFSAQRVAQAIDARAAAKTHTHTPEEIGAAPSHVEVTGDWPTTGTPGVLYWKAE